MNETKYMVEFDGQIVAREMDIQIATTLIKALANEFDGNMRLGAKIALCEEPRCCDKCEVDE